MSGAWKLESLTRSDPLERAMNEPLHFQITVHADPSSLGKLLGHFAQQKLVPQRVRAELSGDMIAVSVVVHGPDDRQAGILAEKIRSTPLVSAVVLHRGMRLLMPLGEPCA
jgi:hypothetical protein